MWRDICLTNREAILAALKLFRWRAGRVPRRSIARATSQRFEKIFQPRAAHARAAEMTRRAPLVAIDGPVGAGKSTVARASAGCWASSTSTRARCTARSRWRRATPVSTTASGDRAQARRAARRSARDPISFDGERIMLDGRDVSDRDRRARDQRFGVAAFDAGRSARADARLAARGRRATAAVVMEGRDIGTAVFPDAEFKFFLDAERRSARRIAGMRNLTRTGVAITPRGSARAVARARPARPRPRARAAASARPTQSRSTRAGLRCR